VNKRSLGILIGQRIDPVIYACRLGFARAGAGPTRSDVNRK